MGRQIMTIKKHITGILLSLALMLMMLPLVTFTAHAETTYLLWVGGTQVTSANATDTTAHPDWSYDASTNTLTLSGVNIIQGQNNNGIYYKGDKPFTIILSPNTDNKVELVESGIYSLSTLTIRGTGSLTANGGIVGIIASRGITISEGTVNATVNKKNGTAINVGMGDITISGGTVKATATNDNGKGIFSSQGNITINSGNVTATATGEFGDGINANDGNVTISGGNVTATATSNTNVNSIYAEKDITISGGTVTANSSNSGHAGIYSNQGDIKISGGTVNATCGGAYGTIYTQKTITISGDATVTASGGNCIYGVQGVTINGGIIKTSGDNTINSKNDIKINGGTVIATANGENSMAIYSDNGSVIINGGDVTATASGNVSTGIHGNAEIISGKLTAVGNTAAIDGKVKNAITGSGWTDTAGTKDKTDIAISGTARNLTYKKVQFPKVLDPAAVTKAPTAKNLTYNSSAQELVTAGTAKNGTMQYAIGKDAATAPTSGWSASIPTGTEAGTYYVWYKAAGDNIDYRDSDPACVTATIAAVTPAVTQHTITYDLNGGKLDGQTGTVTIKADEGSVITLPAPTRKGYTFDYWEGSKYNAGDKYTVSGDHTFKAVWKAAGGSSKKGANTGDSNALGAWIALLAAALAGATGMAFLIKKRKSE